MFKTAIIDSQNSNFGTDRLFTLVTLVSAVKEKDYIGVVYL